MAHTSKSKIDKIEHPQVHYKTPDDLIEDHDLSLKEKMAASTSGNRTRVNG